MIRLTDTQIEACRSDFRNFIAVVWAHLNLPEPTPVQYDIAEYLQYGPKRSIIEAYRGAGKSYLTSAFADWIWWNNPNHRVMVVSGSKERADAFSQFCLRLIHDIDVLRGLVPRKDQRRSLIAFDVNGARPDHSPSCKSVGITGQLTGSRADIIIADDVETPKNSMTVTQREKLRVLVQEFDAVIKPEAHSRIIYLGTPQVEDSLYNHLAEKGYQTRIWPARYPNATQKEHYGGKLAPWIIESDKQAGSPVDPKRFDDEDLKEREASYGRTGFALQFMLDTSLSDALKFPLKCSDAIVMDIDPEIAPVKVTYASSPDQMVPDLDCVGLKGDRWYSPLYVSEKFEPYEGSVMFIDPAGRGADKTGYAVVKHLRGMLWLTRAGGMTGGYDDKTLKELSLIAKREQVNHVIVESNFGDGMFTKLLQPVMTRVHPVVIEEIHHTKQKELRIIDTLEPILNSHRLVIDKSLIRADLANDPYHQLFYQMTHITRDRGALAHDDLLDSVAGAVAYWVDAMGRDNSQAEEDHEREAREETLDQWLKDMGQSGLTKSNWTDRV